VLATTIDVNRARLALRQSDTGRATALVESAVVRLSPVGPIYAAGLGLLAAGSLTASSGGPVDAKLIDAERTALDAAVAVGERMPETALHSAALGALGRLAEQKHDLAMADRLTAQAAEEARQLSATDLEFRWRWQQARIANAQHRENDAIAAYRIAVSRLDTVWSNIPITYQDGRSSYEEVFRPLYEGYVSLLFAAADRRPDDATALVSESISILERLKNAELQDYIKISCAPYLPQRQTDAHRPLGDVAVLYPIVLDHEVHVVLTIGNLPPYHLKLQAPAGDKLLEHAEVFHETLTAPGYKFLAPAERLYDYIIRPIQSRLRTAKIDTLIVVPDRRLRDIPFAALFDGKSYLIQNYAVVSVPWPKLPEPSKHAADGWRTLIVGLSEAPAARGAPNGTAGLPHVAEEAAAVKQALGATVLMDQDFTPERFDRQLQLNAYNLVHIATHARFDPDSGQSWLTSYGGDITSDELRGAMKYGQFRRWEVALLTLSACETTAGGGPAPLGLAGVALKSGARSVVATLWPIYDATAPGFMYNFYGSLRGSAPDDLVSTAKALQNAQRAYIDGSDGVESLPVHWAPFVLVGAWSASDEAAQ
jgi:CHAT domain-containing protein